MNNMIDVFYTTSPYQINCDSFKMRMKKGETTSQVVERAKQKVKAHAGKYATFAYIGI